MGELLEGNPVGLITQMKNPFNARRHSKRFFVQRILAGLFELSLHRRVAVGELLDGEFVGLVVG